MTHSNIEDYLKENQKLMEELNRANLEKEKLDNEIARLKHENNELNQKIIEFILEQLRLGKSKTFGRSSDTSVCEATIVSYL
jgi:cell division protein FtsL